MKAVERSPLVCVGPWRRRAPGGQSAGHRSAPGSPLPSLGVGRPGGAVSPQSECFLKMSKHNIQKIKNIYDTEMSGERCPVFVEEGLGTGEEVCESRFLGGGASPV